MVSFHFLISAFTVSHPGVTCSRLRPGKSGGDFGPVREQAEGAGLRTGGGEETPPGHRHTPPGPSHQPRHTHHT